MASNSRRRSNSNIPSQYQHPKGRLSVSFLEQQNDKVPSVHSLYLRTRRRMRSRNSVVFLGVFIFVCVSVYYLRDSIIKIAPNQELIGPNALGKPHIPGTNSAESSAVKSKPPQIGNEHPVWQLVKDAEKDWHQTLQKQSKSLSEAVKEYRRRYSIHPPPNFDKWYSFAKKRNVQLIDEYDLIHQSLTPFWGLKPATIRARAREALGFDGNNLIGALIRKGELKKIDGGGAWQMEATEGMLEGFIKWLPDMDLCFNIHDEPRVVVPYDDLSRLVDVATKEKMPAAASVVKPKNSFSKPKDLSDGVRFDDVRTTRFNIYAHQPTWIPSRMSCPPESPARALEDGVKVDNFESYSIGELGFVYNQTAFSDICQSPSFSETYGFFDRPNAFNIVHDLFPIFSQSKVSSFNDIVYPSPWYWYGKVAYNETTDMNWNEKEDKMWWRGSTTGGFSRDGGWRRQHRQHLVQKINSNDNAKIMTDLGKGQSKEDWQVKEVPRSEYKELFDVHFSHVGQCDPSDCDAQKQFFEIKEQAQQEDAWKYKYLLDIDGNAFSGRFYAFLKSKSLVYKLAVFREWHEEWLKPWVHYIPLSLRGDEWVEAVRWFAGEATGKKEAERIALNGREWSDKVLRNDDLEVWLFRLLLEYGRVVDDNRDSIGYYL